MKVNRKLTVDFVSSPNFIESTSSAGIHQEYCKTQLSDINIKRYLHLAENVIEAASTSAILFYEEVRR